MSQEDREIKFISMPRYQMRRHALKKLLKKSRCGWEWKENI